MANRFTGGPSIAIAIDAAELGRLTQFTEPRLYARAQQAGLRAAGRTAKAQIPRGIAERYTIPSRRAKQDISNPYIRGDSVTLRLSAQPPTALQYRFKPGSRGGSQPGQGRGRGWGKPSTAGRPASMQVVKGRAPSALPGAFLAKGLPMIRTRRSRGRGSLQVLHGPSVARIFTGRSAYARELQATSNQAIKASYLRAFQKTLSDASRGYGGSR